MTEGLKNLARTVGSGIAATVLCVAVPTIVLAYTSVLRWTTALAVFSLGTGTVLLITAIFSFKRKTK